MKRKLFLAAVFLMIFGSVYADGRKYGKASYYTYRSCVREGTSGVYTANGERFNEMDMTCAIRSRDWNHLWRVCNTENGKCVEVRNNDFGPGKKPTRQGVIVDLSKGAYMKIANLKTGRINVSVEQVR